MKGEMETDKVAVLAVTYLCILGGVASAFTEFSPTRWPDVNQEIFVK